MENAYNAIKKQQQSWALAEQIEFDKKGYVKELRHNLFQDLDKDSFNEFGAGKGRELEGHMLALHSSSALLVNMFEYWRQAKRISEIAEACGATPGITDMIFEKQYKISNLGTPHLDIEFSSKFSVPFVIEAKFTEPYRKITQRNDTNLNKYLARNSLWDGIQKCKKLAQTIFEQEGKVTNWKHLDSPQLLKHILGLTGKFGIGKFNLLYLWYYSPSPEAEVYRDEINNFKEIVETEVLFSDMTYQELFGAIQTIPDLDSKYLAYLKERYFPELKFPPKNSFVMNDLLELERTGKLRVFPLTAEQKALMKD